MFRLIPARRDAVDVEVEGCGIELYAVDSALFGGLTPGGHGEVCVTVNVSPQL